MTTSAQRNFQATEPGQPIVIEYPGQLFRTPGFSLRRFASSMKQVSGVKAEIDLDAAAPRFEF